MGKRVVTAGYHEWAVHVSGNNNVILGVCLENTRYDSNCLVALGDGQAYTMYLYYRFAPLRAVPCA